MNSLLGTEVDVVLETPKHLFIGEVKHESTFEADGKLVLVHQLMRQYVMVFPWFESLGAKPAPSDG